MCRPILWNHNTGPIQMPATVAQESSKKNENNSTSPNKGNFFRLYAQPCSVLNLMPKAKERAWRARQFREIIILNHSKCQQPQDSPSKNENNSTSPDRGIFLRLYGQPCSVLNAMSKVKERTRRARRFREIKILDQSKCQQPKKSHKKNENNSTSPNKGFSPDFMRSPVLSST